jgi:DNA-binding response OmpR family regulator
VPPTVNSVVRRPGGFPHPVFAMIDRTPLPSAPRILVVDDEPAIRDLLCRALPAAGFRVLHAAGGAEALALLGAEPESPDVALVDRNMPGMGGEETAAAIQRLRPGLPILLATGEFDGRLPESCAGLILKPFSLGNVVARLRELIRAGSRTLNDAPAPTAP